MTTTYTTGITASSLPNGMAYSPADGNIWFSEYVSGKIAKITSGGTVTEYATPSTTGTNPRGLCYGPDGNIWYCGYGNNKIGKITTSGTVTEYTCPTAGAPYNICSDGTDLWFAYSSSAKVCKVTTSGTFTEYSISGFAGSGICFGPDGNVWAVDSGNHKVQKITLAGSVTGYAMTTNSDSYGICSDGTNLWYGAYTANKIVKVTTAGSMTEYSTAGGPYGLAYAGDDCVYFTTNASGTVKLKKVTSAGTVSNVDSTGTTPYYNAFDGVSGMWWADGGTHAIYKYTVADHVVIVPPTAGVAGNYNVRATLPAPTIVIPDVTVTAPALAVGAALPTPVVHNSYESAIMAESSLQSFWKLIEASGNGADSKGSITATAAGTLTYSQTGPTNVGPGVKSDGTNPTAFDCGDVYNFNGTANYTAEAWFKPTTGGGAYQRLISTADGALGAGWDLSYYLTTGKIYAQRHTGSGGTNILTDSTVGTALTAGTWYHIACTYDGTNLRVYLNGVLQDTSAADATGMVAGTTELSILNSAKGNSVTRLPTNGTMTHVAIYNAALSAGTLLAHYSAGIGAFGGSVTAVPLAVGVANNITSGPYIDSTAALDTAPSVNVGLSAPAVGGAFGSSSPTVTAPPLGVAVSLSTPTVDTPVGATSPALAVSVSLVAPVISTGSGGATGATIVVPPFTVAVTLPTPNNTAAYYWLRARRSSSMSTPTKTYVQVQAKGTARTATWTSPTYKAETEAGILVVLDVTAASGTGGLTLRINAHDQASSQAVPLNAAPTAVTATGTTSYVLYPFGAVAGSVTQATSFYLPRMFSITVTHGDSSSYSYSVGYCLLP